MKTIDFTNECWGHAIHGETMRRFTPKGLLVRLADRWKNRRRYTVLVHSMEDPYKGDRIVYMTQKGKKEAIIMEVESFPDPKDMFKLEIVICDEKQ